MGCLFFHTYIRGISFSEVPLTYTIAPQSCILQKNHLIITFLRLMMQIPLGKPAVLLAFLFTKVPFVVQMLNLPVSTAGVSSIAVTFSFAKAVGAWATRPNNSISAIWNTVALASLRPVTTRRQWLNSCDVVTLQVFFRKRDPNA